MSVSLSATIKDIMKEEERVTECYYAIMDLLHQYGCEFELSVTYKSNGDQDWSINVKIKEDSIMEQEGVA